ncbi:acid phosphatase/vanadium-dependent haloperoxidase-related protein [Dunaliella salina]|uniref:Acid phosphatase/vanadium-dependent haloperoxidase-related protein n=1 Tax=Dunaliella salina TaxID=3046 RepID=A0ABQ7GML8_DUNSA|nr:acid phosphatase/vanadium-dependent haloperoxidase-related protein [Dunaliella salina]|eukprot:KAF5835855.1 acid phosphatase/vanadium-dependent haloperoxidase-related protein [Dunaliella salina]
MRFLLDERIRSPISNSSALNLESSSESGLVGLFHNGPFLVAVLCFAVSQIIKFILNYFETKELHWERLWGSGGMPSAHSAFVVGLTTAVGIREGTSSSLFAVALVLTLIVQYDAVGVRLHAGHQAVALNAIISELPQSHPLLQAAASGSNGNAENGRMMLREKLGHTPQQVIVGSVLGFVIAVLFHSILSVSKG